MTTKELIEELKQVAARVESRQGFEEIDGILKSIAEHFEIHNNQASIEDILIALIKAGREHK